MSTILGSTGDDAIIFGTQGNDDMNGLAGDDVLHGRAGDDVLKGGTGSDVVIGGFGADTFQWSAGHLTEGATDYVYDFSLKQGDSLNFLDSANGDFEVLSITHGVRGETEANGINLRNGFYQDITFVVRNSETGATQEIVVLDAFNKDSHSGAWEDYLDSLGLAFDSDEPEICEVHAEELTIEEISPGTGAGPDDLALV